MEGAAPQTRWTDSLDGSGHVSLRWSSPRFALLAFGITVVACMFCSFLLPGMLGDHEWVMPGDGGWTVRGAEWVANGAIGTVYQGDPYYLPLPGLLILLAPVVALGGHFNLVTNQPVALRYPSMWLLVGPAFFLLGSTCILGVDYLADTLGVAASRRRLIAMAIGLLVVVPTCVWAGHPEDLLALGLSCLALAFLLRGSNLAPALTLSVAVMMQPWAGLLVPVLVAASPAGRRLRALVWSSALPGACGLLLFALDFKDAYRALVVQPMVGAGQKLPWWSLTRHTTLRFDSIVEPARVGSMSRSAAVVVAIAVAFWVLRDRRPSTIIAASSIALLARGVFESQFWSWYVAPAAVLMAVGVAAGAPAERRRWVGGASAAFLVYGLAGGSYDWSWHPFSPWLALVVLVGAGWVAVAASLPHKPGGLGGRGPAAAFDDADLELAGTLDSLEGASNYASWIFDQMDPYLGSDLLEVGAGHGTFTELLAGGDRRVLAVDLSRRCAEVLRDRFAGHAGVHVAHGDLSAVSADGPFDTVVMINVLEHIEDDARVLDDLRAMLRPGGRLVLWVPALPGLYSEFDRRVGHFRRYRLADLRARLDAAGFTAEDVHYANAIGALGWWLSARVLRGNPTVGPGVRYFDRYLVPVVRRVESWYRPPFGQSILAVATRP